MAKNSTWVVVADKCHAKIYRMTKFPKLEEIAHLDHPESGLHNQELVSSREGREFQRFGTARSGYQQATLPKQAEAIKFATEIANFLYTASNNNKFNQLYLIATPAFLGLLRQPIHPQIMKHVLAEIPKQLTSANVQEIEQQRSEL